MFTGKPKTLADMVAIFWSLPPDAADWHNLTLSQVSVVLLDFYVSATTDTLKRLQALNKGVVLRLNDHDSANAPIDQLRRDLEQKRWVCPNIEALILGNEPDAGLSLQYGAPWYGDERAWPHAVRTRALAEALDIPGLKLVTPGWECHIKSEDDPATPGVYSWRDYCGEAYQHPNIDGHGSHLYGYGFRSDVDKQRVKWQLRDFKMRFHRGPIWLDEVGFAHGEPHERMEQFVAFLQWLHEDLYDPQRIKAGRLPLLDRVAFIAPFVANGRPVDDKGVKHWDPRWLMKEARSYDALGAFLHSIRTRKAA